MFSSLFLYLLATLRKNFRTDLHDILREGWQWANERMIKFRWRSALPFRYRDCFRIRHYWEIPKSAWLTEINLPLILIRQMAALVRRALAEVRAVPVLLVLTDIIAHLILLLYHLLVNKRLS